MKEKTAKILSSKKKEGMKVKELSKVEGQHINISSGVTEPSLHDAVAIKANIEELKRRIKELEAMLEPLHDGISDELRQFQTSPHDSVEYVNNGLRAYLYPKNTKSGQVDIKAYEKMAKEKGLTKEVVVKVPTVNEKGLIVAMQRGDITHEEFLSVALQNTTYVLEMKAVKEEDGTTTSTATDVNAG
jgi:hypothetical protein